MSKVLVVDTSAGDLKVLPPSKPSMVLSGRSGIRLPDEQTDGWGPDLIVCKDDIVVRLKTTQAQYDKLLKMGLPEYC